MTKNLQSYDKKFAELLNRLREGNHTQNDIDVLKERILRIKLGNKNYPINTTHLFSTNALVNYHNNRLYQASHTEKAEIKCIDIIVGDMSDDLKKKMKEKIPDDASKTMGLYNVVLIAVGAKYDLTANVNVADGMTNGAECIIEKIDYRVINSNRPILYGKQQQKLSTVAKVTLLMKQCLIYHHLAENICIMLP